MHGIAWEGQAYISKEGSGCGRCEAPRENEREFCRKFCFYNRELYKNLKKSKQGGLQWSHVGEAESEETRIMLRRGEGLYEVVAGECKRCAFHNHPCGKLICVLSYQVS